MPELYLILSPAALLGALSLLVLKLTGCIKAEWLGVIVWILLLMAFAWGMLLVAHEIASSG